MVDFNRENNIAKEKNMELNCPVCNYKIDVNPLEKGKVITCPNCNSLSQILAILLVVAGILVPVTMLIIKMTEIKKEYERKESTATKEFYSSVEKLTNEYDVMVMDLTQPYPEQEIWQIDTNTRNDIVKVKVLGNIACKNGLVLEPSIKKINKELPLSLITDEDISKAEEYINQVERNIDNCKAKLRKVLYSHVFSVVKTTKQLESSDDKNTKGQTIKIKSKITKLFSDQGYVISQLKEVLGIIIKEIKSNNALSRNEIAEYNNFLMWLSYIRTNLINENREIEYTKNKNDNRKKTTRTYFDDIPRRDVIASKIIEVIDNSTIFDWVIDESLEDVQKILNELKRLREEKDRFLKENWKVFWKALGISVLSSIVLAFILLIVSDIIMAHLDLADNSWKILEK